MPALVLAIAVLWLVLALEQGVWLHWRWTGRSGLHPAYRAYAARVGQFAHGVGRLLAADAVRTRPCPLLIQSHRWRLPGDSLMALP
jgi:hypothetical protein